MKKDENTKEGKELSKNMKNKQSGITLIALVVTIIVLLILAAITLNGILGKNGLLKLASDAKNKTNEGVKAEQDILTNLLDEVKELPDVPDIGPVPVLPHKELEELIGLDYIPIYTVEQYKKIASGEVNYEIRDLSGSVVSPKDTSKTGFDMLDNAKYALMNDIDFGTSGEISPISILRGEFYGNGYKISNITIKASEERYEEAIDGETEYSEPGAMFSFLYGANIHDLYVDNANVTGNTTVGVIGGKGKENTIIENCYITNPILHDTGASVGGIIGFISNSNDDIVKIKNCRVSDLKIENLNTYSYASGIVTTSMSNLEIDGCNVLNTKENSTKLRAGIVNCQKDTGNITIKNSNVQNLNVYAGGIISVSEGNLNIENCNAKKINVDGAGVVGTIVASCDRAKEVIIRGCNVQDIEINGSCTGGIMAVGGANTTIEKCNVKNLNSNVSKNMSSCTAGIVATIDENSNINDCYVQGFNATSNEERLGTFAGIMCIARFNAPKINIKGCTVENFFVDADFEGGTAGIVYQMAANSSITDCKVKNININYDKKYKGSYMYPPRIAGIISVSIKEDTTILNSSVNTFSVNANAELSGIGGISFSSEKEINDCHVSKMNVIRNVTTSDINIAGVSVMGGIINDCSAKEIEIKVNDSSINFGGIAAFHATVDNCKVNNVKLNSNKLRMIGGIVGENSGNEVSNCEVNEFKMISEISSNGYNLVGGITGCTGAIDKCVVKNSELYSLDNLGGICGNTSSNITNCSVEGTKLIGNNHTGGIVGMYWGNNSEGNTVIDCDIETTSGCLGGICGNTSSDITNCSVNGTKLTGSTHTGGIVGMYKGKKCEGNTVTDCNIETKADSLGGICGNTSSDITNCSVEGTKLTGNTYIGGIVGMYSGSKCEGNTVTNCNIETTASGVGGIIGHGDNRSNGRLVNDCHVIGTTIKGVNEVGGISGACAVKITNCNVEGGSITGTGEGIGGIQGNGGNIGISYYPSTITDCKVKGTPITGGTDVGDIQGKDSYTVDEDGNEIPSGRDTITGCSKEN